MTRQLGSRQRRVLEEIRWACEEWGPIEIGCNVESLASSLPIDVEGLTPRESFRVAERLEELGFIEINREEGVVRVETQIEKAKLEGAPEPQGV